MPQVSEVSVRFMRKIQVRDYEPAECEVGLKAVLLDGEDPKTAVDNILAFASAEVHSALGLPTTNALPKIATIAAGTKLTRLENGARDQSTSGAVSTPVADIPDAGAKTPAQQAKEAKKAAAQQTQAAKAAASDIPDDSAPPAAQQAKPAAAEVSDIPDDKPVQQAAKAPQQAPQTQAPAAAPKMTATELSKWVGDQVRAGKITSAAVKSVYPAFGVQRLVDLKEDQVAPCKAKLDELINEHAAAASL